MATCWGWRLANFVKVKTGEFEMHKFIDEDIQDLIRQMLNLDVKVSLRLMVAHASPETNHNRENQSAPMLSKQL